MFKLNKKLEYALISLDCIQCCESQLLTAKNIAESKALSFDSVARVLQIMTVHQVLISEKGANGGYRIGPQFEGLNFYDLMQMILGQTAIAKCLTDTHLCELSSQCNIKTPVQRLNDQLINFYRALSVKELLQTEHHPLLEMSAEI